MVGIGKNAGRDVFHQLFFNFKRGFGMIGQSDAVCDTEDMGVHRHGRTPESDSHDHVGSLTPYTGKFLKLLHIIGHDTSEISHEFHRHAMKVFRFIIGIRNGFNILMYFLNCRSRHGFRVRETLKQGGSDHIHPLVRALGRKNHCHQEFIRTMVVQFSIDVANIIRKPCQDAIISFFLCHNE